MGSRHPARSRSEDRPAARPPEGDKRVGPAGPHLKEGDASLRVNVLANYASQIYVALVAILTMPFYLRHMGAEAYGLIGFFMLMNAWFQILDAGLSLTLTRESARFRAGVINAATLLGLVKALEIFFFGLAGVGAAVIVIAAHAIATTWLRVERLPVGEVTAAVMLMGLTVPLEWVTGLYRGAINGFERQVWLSGFNAAIATLRFGGAAVIILVLGATAGNFFSYQLAVSSLQLVILVWMSRRILPPASPERRHFPGWREIRSRLKFSGGLAFAVVVWVLVTQIDKLVLSKILPLADYGIFCLAAVAAGGVLILGVPVSQALPPRLTKVAAEGRSDEVIHLYRAATQLVCVITIPAALALALFSTPVIFAWTGDVRAAGAAGPILTPYALGNGIVTLGAFPYYLQYARGDLRLHIIGNFILVLCLVPAIALAALRYGAVGAGYAWLGVNALSFCAWIPWVHRRLAPGLYWTWLTRDILPIAAAAALAGWALLMVLVWPKDRLPLAVMLVAAGGAMVLAAACASSMARERALAFARRIGARSMSC